MHLLFMIVFFQTKAPRPFLQSFFLGGGRKAFSATDCTDSTTHSLAIKKLINPSFGFMDPSHSKNSLSSEFLLNEIHRSGIIL